MFLLALGCARSARKPPPAEPARAPARPQGAQRPSESRDDAAQRSATAKTVLVTREPSCLEGVDVTLDADSWYDAAARACHPGSSRSSAVITQRLSRDVPATIEIPEPLRSSCWTAFAIADSRALPIAVDIINDADHSDPFSVLSSLRSSIPTFGPLCSLKGSFRKLRFRPSLNADTRLSLVFYGPSPSSRLPPLPLDADDWAN